MALGLIIAGRERNHVVEHTRFYSYAFSQNQYAHDIPRDMARDGAAGLQDCSLVCLGSLVGLQGYYQ